MPSADLNVLCWEGYDYPALLEPFAAEHGVTARGEAHVSDAGTVARLIGGEAPQWQVINLNNPFAREVLYPRGLIQALDAERFRPQVRKWLPEFADLYRWAESEDGALIGICQRFGPFNLVINSDRISPATAEDAGFNLADDPSRAGRFGILDYDDFNIFHICIAAGLDPFTLLDAKQLQRFAETARRWFDRAALVTADHIAMNRVLVDGDIDFYLSGGVFSASPARLDGHRNVQAITPSSGPIDGRGGIVFAEVTSVMAGENAVLAENFLAYLLRPEIAAAVALSEGTVNPVVQMADPDVMAAFDKERLAAIQWDTLEQDIARCAPYRRAPNHDDLHDWLVQAKSGAHR